MSATERVVVLFEKPDGNTVAIVCNSRERADAVRDVSPFECVGTVPLVPLSEAVVA